MQLKKIEEDLYDLNKKGKLRDTIVLIVFTRISSNLKLLEEITE
jgi:hypothetical protein